MNRCPNCGTIHQYNTECGFCLTCNFYLWLALTEEKHLPKLDEWNVTHKLTPATPPSLSQRFNQLARMYENSANHCTPGSELQSVLEDAASRIRRILAGDEQMMEFLDLNAPLVQENRE